MSYIFKYKTAAMRKVLNLASWGHVYYKSGTVSTKKAANLRQKFIESYSIDLDKDRRTRFRLKGLARTHMVMYYCKHDQLVHWFLLSTPGEGSIFDKPNDPMRNLCDRNYRLKITAPVKKYSENSEPPAYEIIRYWGWSEKKEKSVLRFTWKYDKRTVENYKEQLSLAVHRATKKSNRTDKLLFSMLESIRHTPGFHESRRKAIALYQHAQRRWRKQGSGSWPYGGFTKGAVRKYRREEKYDANHFLRLEQQRQEKIFRGVKAA